MRVLRVFWAALLDLRDDMVLLLACNLLWAVLGLPLLLLALLALNSSAPLLAACLALLAVLPLAPVTLGLFSVAEHVAAGYAASVGVFFVGLRQHWRRGWLVLGSWLLGLILLLVNIRFYGTMQHGLALLPWLAFCLLLCLWGALLLYLFPLTLHVAGLRRIGTQAALMVLGRPLFSFGTLLLMLPVVLVSLLLPFVLLTLGAALLALWSTHATRDVQQEGARQRAALREQAGAAPGSREHASKHT